MITLVAAASVGWLSFRWLGRLPAVNDLGQSLMFVWWGHTEGWWRLMTFVMASGASLVLLGWALVSIDRRLSGGPRRVVTVMGAASWLGLSVYLGLSAVFLSIVSDDPVVVQADPGDRMLLVTDLVETTRYQVWVGGPGPQFVRVEGAELVHVVDLEAARCGLTRQGSADLLLQCGSRSLTAPRAAGAGQPKRPEM